MSFTGVMLAGRYRLDEPIAAGAVGQVWRGLDAVLERPVAVKLLRAEYAQHADILTRFRAEARHAGSLSHPGIAQVYDYGEADPPYPPFLVLELVDGPSLAGLLAGGPLDPARVMDVRDGLVKITDFGIAHTAWSAPLTRTGTLIGTPAYMAPERVAGAAATPAGDLYSLGIVAYECLTGAQPFSGIPVEVALAHRDRPLPPLAAAVPSEVAALVTELTAKDPAARPASAGQVATRAGRLRDAITTGTAILPAPPQETLPVTLAGMPLPDPPPAPRRPQARTGHLARAAALAAAGIVTAVLAVVLLAGLSGPSSPQRHRPASTAARTPDARRRAASSMVEVNGGSLAGQPVSTVRRQLRHLGLTVRVLWQPSDLQPPGTVLSARPDGQVPAGSLIVLTAALQPHGHGKKHGHGRGHHGD